MRKKGLNLVMNVSICILIVMALFVVVSCKQSEEEATTPTQPQKTDTKSDTVEQVKETVKSVSEVSVEPVKETVKSVSETTEETKVTTPTTKDTEKVEQPESKDASASKWVPIPIKLPKPMFVGTPQDTKVENLEKPLGKPRPPFYAPPGVKNVAFEKPVSSTDEEPIIGEIEMITDGDKEAADGSYVELGPLKQSITIDLEAEYEIYAIVCWHYHKQARVYFDVVVQVASDPDFITNVTTLFNNDIDNSAGQGVGEDKHYTETSEGRLIAGKGVKARYIRLFSQGNNSNDLNHYIEVEVYGKPAG
ncbi:MAG: hypothetical protein ACYS67_06600 [Planctomycetota bacterium]|jgi:hypothetical protein